MKHLMPAIILSALAVPALAQDPQGDAEAGKKAFERQCIACHVVVNPDGETLAGRKARTGPNLYGIAGATIGAVDGFRYGSAITTLNEQGAVWDEASFVGYVQDPTRWLRDTLSDKGARGKMAFKVRKEQDALDIYAFLHSIAQ